MKVSPLFVALTMPFVGPSFHLTADEGGIKAESRERAPASRESKRRPSERQAANVFRAYDKNRDGGVTVDEWLAMRHLTPNDRTDRARVERSRFQAAKPGADGRMSQQEFVYWYTQARFNNVREGGNRGPGDEATAIRRGPRDGEGRGKPGPREGEGRRRAGPRDGEGGARPGPREGEGSPRKGPRDMGGVSPESRVIVINTDNRGRIVSGERRAMDAKQMRAELQRIAATADGRKVYIRAAQGMPIQALQSLVRECQAAGIKNLFLSQR